MKRALKAFGDFWWDFLIGDTPEFAVVTLIVVGLAFALHSFRVAGVIILPAVTLVAVALSALRARRH